MKILLGVPEYPPFNVGGGGEVFKNLAENYRKLGHDVVVIYGYYPTKSWWEDIREYTDENGIKFYQIPEIPYPRSLPYLRTAMPPNLRVWFKLKRIIVKEKPDVAHLHGYGLISINIMANSIEKLKIKYIFTIHGYPETPNKNFFLKIIWNLYVSLIMNKTLKKADIITCISDYIKNDKRNICRDKSTTIFNGINSSDYMDVKNSFDARKNHNIDAYTLVILSIGRISEMKGFQIIIKLIKKFLNNDINIKYLIIGSDDGYKNRLQKLIEQLNVRERVEFIGFVEFELKKQYLKQCDVLAIPSLWEPFGLVALEGMIYDKVILTTGTGGLEEVLNGYEKKICLYDEDFIEQLKSKEGIKSCFDYKKFDWKNISEIYLNYLSCKYVD